MTTFKTVYGGVCVRMYISFLQPRYQLKSSQPKSIQAKPFQLKESQLGEIRAGEIRAFPDSNEHSSESDAFADMDGEYETSISSLH